MKLAPKHYRLMSILQERGSVPARIRPVIREELVAMGLAEHFHCEEWLREKERYRLTKQGRELLEKHDKEIEQEKQRAAGEPRPFRPGRPRKDSNRFP